MIDQMYDGMLHAVGVLNYQALRPMFQYMNKQGMRNIIGCEIGVYQGKNALNILKKCDILFLYLIEPDKKKILMHRFKPYTNKVDFFFDYSYKVYNFIPDNLDFVYIDGDHSYLSVTRDIELFVQKVKNGGIIGGHDFNNYEVAHAVVDCFGNDDIMTGGFATDWWIKKGG